MASVLVNSLYILLILHQLVKVKNLAGTPGNRTQRVWSTDPNDFEDRGGHQPHNHSHSFNARVPPSSYANATEDKATINHQPLTINHLLRPIHDHII